MFTKGFWEHLKHPIIGLAPMDGVTDEPFRFITAKYGKPDFQITEFTSVEGICAGALKTLEAFLYDENERPVVAQIFGSTPEAFYKVAFVIAELGFDGIDINMGCPAKNVASKGAGAGLILTPELAKEIVRATQKGVTDWANGKNLEEVELPPAIVDYVRQKKSAPVKRGAELPVSVKTRIGYNSIVIEEWIKHLLEVEPVNISIHGRTLKQLYSGSADWEAIAKAVQIIHQTETTVLGNGDIKNLEDAQVKIKQYGVDGVLIGRAAFGNPWVFKNCQPELEEKLAVAVEHARYYEKTFSGQHFIHLRKHLAWYCRGFPGASEIRQKLMQAKGAEEVEGILKEMNN
jgi:tRNA-dihydrouridine synthase B